MEQTFNIEGYTVVVRKGTYCDFMVYINEGNISEIYITEDGKYALTNGGDYDRAGNETILEAIQNQFKYDEQFRYSLKNNPHYYI